MNWPLLVHIVFLLWLIATTVTEATVGFTPKEEILKLVFEEDTPLHGLTVRVKPCTVGEWNEMLRQSAERKANGGEVAEANDQIAQLFLGHVVEWDLEIPEGELVPLTLEGWQKIDHRHAGIMITAWQLAMVGIPKISSGNSENGRTSEEQSLDLAKLSESLPSWNSPSLPLGSAIGSESCRVRAAS